MTSIWSQIPAQVSLRFSLYWQTCHGLLWAFLIRPMGHLWESMYSRKNSPKLKEGFASLRHNSKPCEWANMKDAWALNQTHLNGMLLKVMISITCFTCYDLSKSLWEQPRDFYPQTKVKCRDVTRSDVLIPSENRNSEKTIVHSHSLPRSAGARDAGILLGRQHMCLQVFHLAIKYKMG